MKLSETKDSRGSAGVDMRVRRKIGVNRPLVALGLVCLLAGTVPISSWDGTGHRLIAKKAIDVLPFPLRAYYEWNERSIVQLMNDTGQWGDHAAKREDLFINLDEYGVYPFAELPRDRNEAVKKFKLQTVTKNGTLPWAIGKYSLELQEAFREQRWDDVKLFSAILAHYVAEAHDPFNTTSDRSGKMSGQPGVAERYTRTLVNRFRMFLIIRPSGAYRIADPVAQAFGMVIEANTWVDNILLSDAQARVGKVEYGDEYYDDFYGAIGAILLRQLTSASTDISSYWYTAWYEAGKPTLPAR